MDAVITAPVRERIVILPGHYMVKFPNSTEPYLIKVLAEGGRFDTHVGYERVAQGRTFWTTARRVQQAILAGQEWLARYIAHSDGNGKKRFERLKTFRMWMPRTKYMTGSLERIASISIRAGRNPNAIVTEHDSWETANDRIRTLKTYAEVQDKWMHLTYKIAWENDDEFEGVVDTFDWRGDLALVAYESMLHIAGIEPRIGSDPTVKHPALEAARAMLEQLDFDGWNGGRSW